MINPPVVPQQGPQQDRPNLSDVLSWAKNHVEAMTAANVAPWHLLRAQMILDGLAALSASRIDPPVPSPGGDTEAICQCGTVMVCPDIGCDQNKAAAVVPSPSAPDILGEMSMRAIRETHAGDPPVHPSERVRYSQIDMDTVTKPLHVEIERLKAALSSPSVADSPTWQPMESAPRNGISVLLTAENNVVLFGFWSVEDCWKHDGSGHTIYGAKFWMPLPAPPAASPQPIVLPTKAEVEAEGFEAVPVDDEPSASSASAEADRHKKNTTI